MSSEKAATAASSKTMRRLNPWIFMRRIVPIFPARCGAVAVDGEGRQHGYPASGVRSPEATRPDPLGEPAGGSPPGRSRLEGC